MYVVSAILTAAVRASVVVWVLDLYVPCATVYPVTDERSEDPDFFHRVVTTAMMSVTTQDNVTAVPLCTSFGWGVTAEILTYILLLGLLKAYLQLLG